MLWFVVGIGTRGMIGVNCCTLNGGEQRTLAGSVGLYVWKSGHQQVCERGSSAGMIDSSGWNDAADSFWVSRWWRVMLIGESNRMLENEGYMVNSKK